MINAIVMKKVNGFEGIYNKIPFGKVFKAKIEIMKINNWNSTQLFSMKKKGSRGMTQEEFENVNTVIKKYL